MEYSVFKDSYQLKKDNKVQVKAFKFSDKLSEFMCKQTSNDWKRNNQKGIYKTLPHKSGHYKFCAGQWHNVKTLPLNMR